MRLSQLVTVELPSHVILDIKMDVTCKARFVAGGHVTDLPSQVTYADVVSRNSVRIVLLIEFIADTWCLCAECIFERQLVKRFILHAAPSLILLLKVAMHLLFVSCMG